MVTPVRTEDFAAVVPVGSGSPLAASTVAALLGTSPPPGGVIVVNDRVRDASLTALPTDDRVRVIANDGPPGPAAARNAGARAASRPYLLFVDADVFVRPDIFARLAAAFNDPASPDAVVGVEAETAGPNATTAYKNLWMRYTYVKLPRRVELFYTSCAAINRDVFLTAGGLDEGYATPSVEDTAFGRTLGARGAVVHLEKGIEVEHRKTYNTAGVLRTSFRRAVALARCILRMGRRGGGNRTSVPTSYVISLPLSWLWLAWGAAVPWSPGGAAAGAVATLALLYALNARWLAFLFARRAGWGWWGVCFLPVELACGMAGGAWGVFTFFFMGRKY